MRVTINETISTTYDIDPAAFEEHFGASPEPEMGDIAEWLEHSDEWQNGTPTYLTKVDVEGWRELYEVDDADYSAHPASTGGAS